MQYSNSDVTFSATTLHRPCIRSNRGKKRTLKLNYSSIKSDRFLIFTGLTKHTHHQNTTSIQPMIAISKWHLRVYSLFQLNPSYSWMSRDSISTVAPHCSFGLLTRTGMTQHSRNWVTWLLRYERFYCCCADQSGHLELCVHAFCTRWIPFSHTCPKVPLKFA